MAADAGRIQAQLVADTARFVRPMQDAQKQLDGFQRAAKVATERLEAMQRVGRRAGIMFGALVGAVALGVRETVGFADEMAKLSTRTGIAIEDLQELAFASRILGVNFSTMERSVARLGRNMVRVGGQTSEAARAIEGLGIETMESDGSMRQMTDLFTDTITELGKMDDEVRRNALAMEIFGRSATELIPLLSAGGEQIEELREQARTLGLVMDEETVLALERLNDEFTIVSQRIRFAVRELMVRLTPAIEILVGWVNDAIDAWGDLDDEIKNQILIWGIMAAAILVATAALGALAAVGLLVGKALAAIGAMVALIKSPLLIGLFALAALGFLIWKAWDEDWEILGRTLKEWADVGLDAFSRLANWFEEQDISGLISAFVADVRTVWAREDLDLPQKIVETLKLILPADPTQAFADFLSNIGRVFISDIAPEIGRIVSAVVITIASLAWRVMTGAVRMLADRIFEIWRDEEKTTLEKLIATAELTLGVLTIAAIAGFAFAKKAALVGLFAGKLWSIVKTITLSAITVKATLAPLVFTPIGKAIVGGLSAALAAIGISAPATTLSAFSFALTIAAVTVTAAIVWLLLPESVREKILAAWETVKTDISASINVIIDYVLDPVEGTFRKIQEFFGIQTDRIRQEAEAQFQELVGIDPFAALDAQEMVKPIARLEDQMIQFITGTRQSIDRALVEHLGKIKVEPEFEMAFDVPHLLQRLRPTGMGPLFPGMRRGGILGGAGGGDIIPALLEPGEAIVPFRVVQQGLAAIMAWFVGQNVRTMQAGGIVGGGSPSPGGSGAAMDLQADFAGFFEFLRDGFAGFFEILIAIIPPEITQVIETLTSRFQELIGAIGAVGEPADKASAAIDDTRSAAQRFRDRLNEIGQSIWQRFRDDMSKVANNLVAFGNQLLTALGPLGILSVVFAELQPLIDALLVPISMVAAALAESLMPVLEALFPVITWFARRLLDAAMIGGRFYNAMLKIITGLFDFLGNLPVIGRHFRSLAKSIEGAEIDIDAMSDAQDMLKDMTFDTAMEIAGVAPPLDRFRDGLEDSTDEIDQMNKALRDVPMGFRIALRRFEAAGAALVNGGNPGNPSPITASPVRAPGGIATDPGGGSQVVFNFNAPVYGFDDFRDVVRRAMAQIEREAGFREVGVVRGPGR